MARIVRQNDESVREGYIRNDGKEVKLFTSALKAFQCNNRIVMAQRKHLDDFLRDGVIGQLECGRTQLPRVSSPGFGNDSKMMIMWSTPSYNAELGPVFGNYCQKKQTEHSIRPVSSALLSYRYDSFKADHEQTLRAQWSLCW
ncbi:uncharacterized protein TNCV_593241 [Trichonephila clavipes]|nr:uncharacterized protein TNCV_593241 [Trichonephila clavipes]